MSEKLKACPFCGEEAAILCDEKNITYNDVGFARRAFVECTACSSRGVDHCCQSKNNMIYHSIPNNVVKLWNTRASDALLKTAADMLEHAAHDLKENNMPETAKHYLDFVGRLRDME